MRWEGNRRGGRKNGREGTGERERKQIIRLAVCILVLLTALFTRNWDRLDGIRLGVRQILEYNGDFRGLLSAWKEEQAQEGGEPSDRLAGLWRGLFVPDKEDPIPTETGESFFEPEGGDAVLTSFTLVSAPDRKEEGTGDLGIGRLATPVVARVSSPFGWREDPLYRTEEERFHNGVDLSVPTGTPILAFAAGRVDEVGEEESYGMYLQLDHGSGIKSLYAHCSALWVKTGERVAAGEVIAASGASGNVTGPHLHFEIRRDGERIDPVPYIRVLS